MKPVVDEYPDTGNAEIHHDVPLSPICRKSCKIDLAAERVIVALVSHNFCGDFDPMGMENYSRYQQQCIKNYYNNRESIAVQRVSELVTELYLAEGKKREKVWDSIANHLGKMGVPPDRISHLRAQDKPELVAKLVTTLV